MHSDDDLFSEEGGRDSDFEEGQSFPQHVATPQAQPSPSPDQISSFQASFPGTNPHFSPPRHPGPTSGRKVPRSLRNFWDENIPESLKTFPIRGEDVFMPICMTPTKDQVGCMYARSKCMELLTDDHPSLLSYPTRAQPLCFVARAGEGLPIHIQKTLFFFASVLHGMQDMAHFTAPTIATDVVVSCFLSIINHNVNLTVLDSLTGVTQRSSRAWSALGWV
jgi:hypothetical protein